MAPDLNNALIRELLEEKSPTVIIATDGSIRGDTAAWGGAIWRKGRVIFEWSSGRHGKASSYRVECEAMEDAVIWLQANTSDDDRVVILRLSEFGKQTEHGAHQEELISYTAVYWSPR